MRSVPSLNQETEKTLRSVPSLNQGTGKALRSVPSLTNETLPTLLCEKRDQLLHFFKTRQKTVVAFSGGVDSAVVANAAFLALGEDAIAITADSASVPRSEIEAAKELANQIGIRHLIVKTTEFDNADYLKNDGQRCYFCKTELYSQIDRLLPSLGYSTICSGANLDDNGDYRPGLTAAAEKGVLHPLQIAGFSKADVRALAAFWKLPVWDKPASPCLSSRIAPGLAVTSERTLRVELAEAYLKQRLGIRDCRVRYHEGDLARVELPADTADTADDVDHIDVIQQISAKPMRMEIQAHLKSLGFKFVTIDLNGIQSGSLNVLVDLNVRAKYQIKSDQKSETKSEPQQNNGEQSKGVE